MAPQMQVSRGDPASGPKGKIALLGTGSNLRLSKQLQMINSTERVPAGASKALRLLLAAARAEADEKVPVPGGDPTGHDRESGTGYVSAPNGEFPRTQRDCNKPHVSDLEELDDDFAAIWQMLRKTCHGAQVPPALLPSMPDVTLSRAKQNQRACIRARIEDWGRRFADVNCLPIWDAALPHWADSEGDRQKLAHSPMNAARPRHNTPSAANDVYNDHAKEGIMSASINNRARRKERPGRYRKAGNVPLTVCEAELLEAFSK